MALAKHFEAHESYRYAFQSWDSTDSIIHTHSTMAVSRIAQWLAYFGIVNHRTEKAKCKPEDSKATLYHILTAGLRMREAYEKGELLKVSRSYSDPQVIGIGKPYSSYSETSRWLQDTYDQHKVAQWRRSKWYGDFNRLYNENLAKPKEEMQKLMVSWLYQMIGSIPMRGKKALTRERAYIAEQQRISLFKPKTLTDFLGEAK